MGWGYLTRTLFTLRKVFGTNLVSDMPHLINSSKHSKVDDSTSPGNLQNLQIQKHALQLAPVYNYTLYVCHVEKSQQAIPKKE